jgi:succinoglycan biosynthesis transport protein ExoP
MEAGQSGSLPVTEARLISPALPPLSKSILRIPAVLGAALLFGTMVGVGVALIRGRLDTSFRSDAQVERFLTKCIGVIPRLKFGGRHRKTTGGAQMLRFAVDHPFSEFREALRAATVAVDGYCRKGPCKVVAVLSTHPGEGATTVAGNFASQLASVGFKTLLIDADLRDFSLTRLLSNEAKPSLVDILGNLTADGEACQLSSLPGVSFLAFAANDPSQFMPEVLASAEMHRFLDLARQNYSYVVLDLPPLGSFVDASTVASAVDQFILVVEWGRVPRQQVMKALQKSPLVANKLVGVLLNKVPLRLI